MKTMWMLRCYSLAAVASLTLVITPYHSGAAEKKGESQNPVVKESGIESKNEEWAKHYPRQYDSWCRAMQGVNPYKQRESE